jgi:hypothetical protein
MADDEVQLTDLEVIQQFSLAVRGASAPRAQVIAALESDLAYLRGARSAVPKRPVAEPKQAVSTPARKATVAKPPATKGTARKAAKKAPAKKAVRRA